MRFELAKTNQYVSIISQTARFSNKKKLNRRVSPVEQLLSQTVVDIFVDNMCITIGILWIKLVAPPLYVSGYTRIVLSFVHSVTLWIAAFRWRCWLCGLAKT